MQKYNPLSVDVLVLRENDEPISVTVDSVAARLSKISTSKAGGPDDLRNWMLKTFSDILAPALIEVLNQLFRESKVPHVYGSQGMFHLFERTQVYVAKKRTYKNFNKDLRPISLTPTLSKVSLKANGNAFEIVKSAKIVDVTVRNDLKWNDHVDDITAKASRRIYLPKQVKHAGIDRKSLIQFYCKCFRSVLEYACQNFILACQPICPTK